jgi:hypothetical protein
MFTESPVALFIIFYPDVNCSDYQWLKQDHDNLYCLPIKDGLERSGDRCIEGILFESIGKVGEFGRFGLLLYPLC